MKTSHPTVRILILLLAASILSFAPCTSASADMGPKPWMDFPIQWQTGEPGEITSVLLYTCSDQSCENPQVLEQLGPQDITCESNDLCTSMAYGYDDYFQLELTFTSGRTLSSGTTAFVGSGAYPVVVTDQALLISPPERSPLEQLLNIPASDRGRMGFESLFGIGMIVMLLVLLLITLLVILGATILVVILARKAGEEPITFRRAKPAFILVWIASTLIFLPGILISPALPLTALIEGGAVLVYAALRKRNLASFLTTVLLVNLLTVPALALFAGALSLDSLGVIILTAEILIWLVEAAVLYTLQRRVITIPEALLLSLALNLLSFGSGLLLPF